MPPTRRHALEDLGLVACGAVLGALLRWQLPEPRSANLLGCLLLGLLLPHAQRRPRLMLLAGIGFCGSLTTFSGWILGLSRNLEAGASIALAGQLPLDLLAGLAALGLGLGLSKRLAMLVSQALKALRGLIG
jgi:CrcB protein